MRDASARRIRGGAGSARGRAVWLALAVAAVLVLRHDYWQWTTPRPLLFGLLPVGLWWQALVSVLACLVMGLLVRWAWPVQLEEETLDEAERLNAARSPGEGTLR